MLLPVSFAVSVISGGILVRKRATYKINERKRTLARIKPCPGPTSKLAKELEGHLYLPSDNDYEWQEYNSARLGGKYALGRRPITWNRDSMGYPSAIATVHSIKDVQACLRYVSEFCSSPRIPFCVAGGRHSHLCILDDSFVLDVCHLNSISVDQNEMTLTCGGGTQLGNIGEVLEPMGLAFPTGHSGTTGVAGMTIQGGISFMSRTHGLAVDALLEAWVVTADGSLYIASRDQQADLFWALQGGGGNFGVVVQMKFALSKIPSRVYGGLRMYIPSGWLGLPRRDEIISNFRKLMNKSVQGSGMLVLVSGGPVYEVLCHFGPKFDKEPPSVESVLREGRAWTSNESAPRVWKGQLGLKQYHGQIQRFSPNSSGNKLMCGLLFDDLSDELVLVLSNMCHSSNMCQGCSVSIVPLGGTVAKVDSTATAFYHRNAKYWVLLNGGWQGNNPCSEEYATGKRRVQSWMERCKSLLNPFLKGHYAVLGKPDLFDATSPIRLGVVGAWLTVRNVFGSNLRRLQETKAVLDPHNLFSTNDNILPK